MIERQLVVSLFRRFRSGFVPSPLFSGLISFPSSGINAAAMISITGGSYSVNGGGYTSGSGTVNNGNTVAVRLTSSGSYSTQVSATLTIGGVSGSSCATTPPPPVGNGVIFQDNLENGPGSWTANPGTWQLTAAQSHSASHSWTDSPHGNYNDNANASLFSPVLDLTGVKFFHFGTSMTLQLVIKQIFMSRPMVSTHTLN